MKKTVSALLFAGLLSTGCAGSLTKPELPVAASCPPPPPLPNVLLDKPASTAESLNERYERIWKQLEDSLMKAQR